MNEAKDDSEDGRLYKVGDIKWNVKVRMILKNDIGFAAEARANVAERKNTNVCKVNTKQDKN